MRTLFNKFYFGYIKIQEILSKLPLLKQRSTKSFEFCEISFESARWLLRAKSNSSLANTSVTPSHASTKNSKSDGRLRTKK